MQPIPNGDVFRGHSWDRYPWTWSRPSQPMTFPPEVDPYIPGPCLPSELWFPFPDRAVIRCGTAETIRHGYPDAATM